MARFDPYHKWLGIPPEEQPPDHYRLLGLKRFESDPDVIESAADQRMTFLQQCSTGSHVDASQKLLNEVAAARVCLLNPAQKERYDASIGSGASSARDGGHPVPAGRVRKSSKNLAVIGGAVVGVVLLLAVWMFSGSDRETGNGSVPPSGDSSTAGKTLQPEPKSADVSDAAGADLTQPALEPSSPGTGAETATSIATSADETAGEQPDRITSAGEVAANAEAPSGSANSAAPQPAAEPPPSAAVADESPPPSGTARPIDLLRLIDPKRDAVQGDWSFEGSELTSPAQSDFSRIKIPSTVPAEYRLIIEAIRFPPPSMMRGLLIGLPNANGKMLYALDGGARDLSGTHYLDGQDWSKNETTIIGRQLAEGIPSTIVCTVRRSGFQIEVDGRKLVDWSGDYSRHSPAPEWDVQNWNGFWLGSQCKFRISRIELQPLGEDPRLPMPETAARGEAEKSVRELYRREFMEADSASKKEILGRSLLKESLDLSAGPAFRLVLLDEARKLAIAAGDPETMSQAIDTMGAYFEFDALPLKREALPEVRKSARTPEQTRAFVATSLLALDEAIARDDYRAATEFGQLAQTAARQMRDDALRDHASARLKDVAAMQKSWNALRPVFERLEQDPSDSVAALEAGKFLCFIKQDWKRGLPLLAAGPDGELAELAALDLAHPSTPEERVRTADAWWEQSRRESGSTAAGMTGRAIHWYRRSYPLLSGVAAQSVEQRLKDAGEIEVHRISFQAPGDMTRFVSDPPNAKYRLARGELVFQAAAGSNARHIVAFTYGRYFKSISRVTIRGRVLPPRNNNFRVSVGPLHALFNWEGADENQFRNFPLGGYTVTNPSAMTSGQLHEIQFRQEGSRVTVLVDGKKQYEASAILHGTVTIYTAVDGIISVDELIIEGTTDLLQNVQGSSHPNVI